MMPGVRLNPFLAAESGRVLLALFALVALFGAACGGGGSGNGSGGEGDAMPSTQSAPAGESSATPPEAQSPTAQAPATEQTASPVTGVPVPVAEVATAPFDADRLILGANFPPLNDPAIVDAADATWLEEDTIVLGAVQNGEARVYPVFMMAYHHVVNDTLGGFPYLVTY